MQNINDVGCLCEMIQSKEKLKEKLLEFKKKLGLNSDVVICDEQDILSALQAAFEEEIILTQCCIKNRRLDAYFSKYNFFLIMKKVDNQ